MEREMSDVGGSRLPHRQKENPDKGPLDTNTYASTMEFEHEIKVSEIKGNVSGGVKSAPGKYVGTV